MPTKKKSSKKSNSQEFVATVRGRGIQTLQGVIDSIGPEGLQFTYNKPGSSSCLTGLFALEDVVMYHGAPGKASVIQVKMANMIHSEFKGMCEIDKNGFTKVSTDEGVVFVRTNTTEVMAKAEGLDEDIKNKRVKMNTVFRLKKGLSEKQRENAGKNLKKKVKKEKE